jgi:hypothetical protein
LRKHANKADRSVGATKDLARRGEGGAALFPEGQLTTSRPVGRRTQSTCSE